jgi:hypothetical protein
MYTLITGTTTAPLRRLRALAMTMALAAVVTSGRAATLVPDYLATYNFGGALGDQTANLISNVNAAITFWNTVLPTATHTVALDIRLANLGGNNNAGLTTYITKDANGRVDRARLDFNSNTQLWFFDPTPFETSEFTLNATFLNTVPLSSAEALSGCQGPAILPAAMGNWDFLSVAIHEIGHALGIGFNGGDPANFVLYSNEVGDGDIDIDNTFGPLYPGGLLPVDTVPILGSHFNGTAAAGVYNFTTMADPGWGRGTRAFMTDLDILGIASVYDFTINDVNLTHVPEPATVALIGLGVTLILGRRRRR